MPARDDEKALSIVGKRFGKWIVIEFLGRRGKSCKKYYLCKCDCGTIQEAPGSSLTKGESTSCGCTQYEFIDLTGKKFGKLTALEKMPADPKNPTHSAIWKCRCDCGVIKEIESMYLRKAHVKSCGCEMYNREEKRKRDPVMAAAYDAYRPYKDGNITLEDFIELSKLNCTYCAIVPSAIRNVYKNRKTLTIDEINQYNFVYNGLDRIDNSLPHNIDNVVPACSPCNYARRDRTIEEFRDWLIRAYHWFILGIDLNVREEI
jgi:hypothetical protein